MIVIDLMGGEDIIATSEEKDTIVAARKEALRKKYLEEIFKRSPQTQLQIVDIK